MEMFSSHCQVLCINYRIMCEYVCYVIFAGWFHAHCAAGALSIELHTQNISAASVASLNGIYGAPVPTIGSTNPIVTVTESMHEYNATNGTLFDSTLHHGLYYQCRCWNSTLEVSN